MCRSTAPLFWRGAVACLGLRCAGGWFGLHGMVDEVRDMGWVMKWYSTRNRHEIDMTSTWYRHEIDMKSTRNRYDIDMTSTWDRHDIDIMRLHDFLLFFIWFSMNLFLISMILYDCQWFCMILYDFVMRRIRMNSHGFHRNSHGIRMNSHGIPMNSEGVPMNA